MAGGKAGDWGEGRPHQRDQSDTRRSRQGDNTTHPSLQYRPVNTSATAAGILTSHLSAGICRTNVKSPMEIRKLCFSKCRLNNKVDQSLVYFSIIFNVCRVVEE